MADGYGNTDGLFFWLIAFSVGFVVLLLLLKLVSRWIRIPSWLASVLTFACVAAYGFGVSDAPSWLVIAALCMIVVGALLKYARGSR